MNIRTFAYLIVFCLARSKGSDLSCDQIQAFVDGHNWRRLKLAEGKLPNQPAAAEMYFMVWDEELADKASEWASHHTFSHNPNKKLESGRFTTGENIYMSYSTDPNFELDPDAAMDSWFKEYKDYSFGPLRKRDFDGSKKMIGHYTQMAWSGSTYIGCGISDELKNGRKTYYVVCNYGPSGNYLGEKPYNPGDDESGELLCGSYDCSQPYGSDCPVDN